jgi:uncharacterized protein (TIGR03437 family)
VGVTAFPLPLTLGGTSIQVTVGSTTVNAIMFYSAATQVAAILPSKTPSGTGTVTLTYNNQSATTPILVVPNNIGIFTVSSSGTGDAIAFVNADNGLITPTHAANPGDVVVFWGTGLGPVTSDETQPAVETNMTNIPLHVFIGGKDVGTPLFQGRNACCSSVDTVYVTIPQGVSGCAVSVNMQIGSLTSNATSIAVATNGRTCTPINQNPTFGGTGMQSFGSLVLERSGQNETQFGITTNSIADTVAATFGRITFSGTAAQGSQIDVNSYGSCSFGVSQLNSQTITPPSGTIKYLDAGAELGLSAPFGKQTILKSNPSAGVISYVTTLDQTGTTLTAGTYTFTGTGGPDVGQFTATYNMPTPFAWTNAMSASVTTVSRANGLTIVWTGGDPAGYVTIAGLSTLYTNATNSVGVGFSCTARDSDGTLTVPPLVLQALPPTGVVPGSSFTVPGLLTVSSFSTVQPFQAKGLQLAGVSSYFTYTETVTFQ